jgi:phosphatidyl-myo-inositol dimannoside synthase
MVSSVRQDLNILALVTDGFTGHGGIARYNCEFIAALAGCNRIASVTVLPRSAAAALELPARVQEVAGGKHRIAYSMRALITAVNKPPGLIFCGHLFMAPLAALIAARLKIPYWLQLHGIDAWSKPGRVVRSAAERATIVTSVSRYTRHRFLQWANIEPHKVRVLPNTVDARFQPGGKPNVLEQRHGLQGLKVILTVSRLSASEQYKGHDRVISALAAVRLQHPDTVYVIAGDGDDQPRLEALAHSTGLSDHVRFIGRIPAAELPAYYRLADVFAMPSTGEGFGIAYLEAIASGVPVIAGNRDGSVDALADGALGRLVDPNSTAEIAAAICEALAARATNHSKPRLAAERFAVPLFIRQVADLLDTVVART